MNKTQTKGKLKTLITKFVWGVTKMVGVTKLFGSKCVWGLKNYFTAPTKGVLKW